MSDDLMEGLDAMDGLEIEVQDRRNVSDSALLDETSLDPRMHYRFIHERPSQLSKARLKGYKLVRPKKDKVRTLFDQEDKPAEDVIKHGDRVLMAIPKTYHEQRQASYRERAASRLRTNADRVKRLAEEQKVRLSEGDEHE